MKKCDKHLEEAMEIVRKMIILSDDGEANAEDDNCLVLYSLIRDTAYKIRQQVEIEQNRHTAKADKKNVA